MGQYYEAVLRTNNGEFIVLNPHAFNEGAKLLEHSYINNSFVKRTIQLLTNNPMQLAWLGDYADLDDVKTKDAADLLISFNNFKEKEINYEFNKLSPCKKIPISDLENSEINQNKYVIYNNTKKEFVDVEEYLSVLGSKQGNQGNILHPLPILSSIGNGRGGGDYYEASPCYKRVGSWACDEITVLTKSKLVELQTLKSFKFEGYKNIINEVLFLDD